MSGQELEDAGLDSRVSFHELTDESIPPLQIQDNRLSASELVNSTYAGAFVVADDRIETDEDGKQNIVMPSVQEYWRTYASWLACWPGVAEACNDMAVFAKDWKSHTKKVLRCFTIVHKSAIRIRTSATGDSESCTDKCMRPGQLFLVSETLAKEETTYLKLADGAGWVFDKLDGITMVAELEAIELGEWWYTICTPDFVEVRTAPSSSDICRSGWIMCPKEVTLVGLRCSIKGHRYLQLKDGRGWLFEKLPGESSAIMVECSEEQREVLKDEARVTIAGPDGLFQHKSTFSKVDKLSKTGPLVIDEDENEDSSRNRSGGFLCLCGRRPGVKP